MWQGFTIALREGIEAFLIVALTLSYLARTGRKGLSRAVYAGIAVLGRDLRRLRAGSSRRR